MNAPLQPTPPAPIAALFSEHGDFVFRTLQYLGVPGPSLDDGLQDVFVTAHRRWDAFEGRSTPRTWLYGIARRVAFRYRRKDENHRRRFVLTERVVEGVDAPFEQAHARRSVEALLESLDEDKRAAFVLVEVEGFTAAEAAGLLEIPLGTVYSRVRAAWMRLRDAADQDVQVSSLRVEIESERRVDLARAVMAACSPAAGLGTAAASTGLGGLGWILGAAAGASALAVSIGLATRPDMESTPHRPVPVRVSEDAAGVGTPEPPKLEASADIPAAAAPIEEQAVRVSEPTRQDAPPAKRRAKPTSESASSAPLAGLVEELKLIRRAKELARDGKPGEARRVLDRHERTFADGQLVDEREEIRNSLPAD